MEGTAPSQTSPQPLCAATIRDLRRHRALAPGGTEFGELVRSLLPLVFGSASSLLRDSERSVESVVVAVFDSLGFRWRRLSKRTVLATWLLRTTWFAARRERRRSGLAVPPKASEPGLQQVLFGTLVRLSPKALDALALHCVLSVSAPEGARALRRKEARVRRSTERGLVRLGKALRKANPDADPRALVAAVACPAPPEIEARVVSRACAWSVRQPKEPLVRGILRAWRWVGLRRFLRRVLVTIAVSVCVLTATGFTFAWLARQGYLTAWFIEQSNRRIAKEFPELLQPALPWPEASRETVLPSPTGPGSAAELYSLTSVWTARLSFTADQWRGLEPSRVPPVPNMFQPDGKIVLRNPKAQRSGLAGVVGIDFNWTEGRLEFAGATFPRVGVRYRGNGTYLNSLYGPKQSLKVDLNRQVKGQRLAGVRTLNFVNSIPDDSYLRDALAEQLFRDLGVPSPRTAYAYLTIDVPGKFPNRPLGLYVLIENIDADFAADRFGSENVPIFKPVTTELFQDLGDDWPAYAAIYDLKTKATPEQLARVCQFARLVTRAEDAEFAERLAEFLDLEEFAAFLAGHVLLASYDGFLTNGQNYYLFLDPRTGRFGFIPWDQDHSWGEFGYVGSADQRERASIWQPGAYENRFLNRVLQVEAFRAIYRRHLERAVADAFTVERLYPRIDQLAAILRPAVAAESQFRLKRFDTAVSTNWVAGRREGMPEGPRSPVHQIKRFIVNRVASVRDQLAGRAPGEILRMNQGRGDAKPKPAEPSPNP